jgi:hypothetical protein
MKMNTNKSNIKNNLSGIYNNIKSNIAIYAAAGLLSLNACNSHSGRIVHATTQYQGDIGNDVVEATGTVDRQGHHMYIISAINKTDLNEITYYDSGDDFNLDKLVITLTDSVSGNVTQTTYLKGQDSRTFDAAAKKYKVLRRDIMIKSNAEQNTKEQETIDKYFK